MSQCICSRKQRPRYAFETPPWKAGPRFFTVNTLPFSRSPVIIVFSLLSFFRPSCYLAFCPSLTGDENSLCCLFFCWSTPESCYSVSPCEEDRNARGQVYRRNGTVSMNGKEYLRDGLKSGLLCLKGEGNCCTLKKGLLLRRGYYSTDSTTRGYLTKKSVISEYRWYRWQTGLRVFH